VKIGKFRSPFSYAARNGKGSLLSPPAGPQSAALLPAAIRPGGPTPLPSDICFSMAVGFPLSAQKLMTLRP